MFVRAKKRFREPVASQGESKRFRGHRFSGFGQANLDQRPSASRLLQLIKGLKHDLAIRPVFHQREDRIKAHIFVAFIAYCLHVTLKNLARPRAPGLTPRAILEKFSTMQLLDVHVPTTNGRHLVLPWRTDPTRDQQLLLHQLKL